MNVSSIPVDTGRKLSNYVQFTSCVYGDLYMKFCTMQEMKWIFLDDIEHGNIKAVAVATDPAVGTPLFDPTTRRLKMDFTVTTIVNDI